MVITHPTLVMPRVQIPGITVNIVVFHVSGALAEQTTAISLKQLVTTQFRGKSITEAEKYLLTSLSYIAVNGKIDCFI